MIRIRQTSLATTQNGGPLQGVVIFVSQQLTTSRSSLHRLCEELGGKYVWAFESYFTHYVSQGKVIKRGKEYRKVEEYRAHCVHPAWLKACHTERQRVAERLYATTYDPNRSLTFVSTDDDGDDHNDENIIPLLKSIKSSSSLKPNHSSRIIPVVDPKRKLPLASTISISLATVNPSPVKPSLESSIEAETMLNDLESSLAQFLNNNSMTTTTTTTRPSTTDDEQNKKSLPLIRSINTMNNNSHNHGNNNTEIEPSMRVEWLDDAMKAERKKMIDEDEHGSTSSPQQSLYNEPSVKLKRVLTDSNFDGSHHAKKCRI